MVKRGGTLIVGQDVGPVSLDPIQITAHPAAQIYEHLYSTLVQPDHETGKIVPDLAESWEAPDPKTHVFKLRQGVKFHSGRSLTAEDVKYSFERLLDPKNNAPIRAYVGPIDKIEVLGDYSVKFTHKEVYAPFLNAISDRRPIAIVDRETVEKNDGKLSAVSNGTGPFKLVEYIPDNKIVMERHTPYHEKDLPILDRVEFRIIPDEQSRMAAIRVAERKQIYAETQRIYANDVPYFHMYVINSFDPARKEVKGYIPQASQYRPSLRHVWLEK